MKISKEVEKVSQFSCGPHEILKIIAIVKKNNILKKFHENILHDFQQCCGSGSTRSVCFWASWIRIRTL